LPVSQISKRDETQADSVAAQFSELSLFLETK